MLVVFTGYLNDIEAPPPNTAEEDIKLSKSFVDFMGAHADIATMIQKGKGKLKWERDVPEDIQVFGYFISNSLETKEKSLNARKLMDIYAKSM